MPLLKKSDLLYIKQQLYFTNDKFKQDVILLSHMDVMPDVCILNAFLKLGCLCNVCFFVVKINMLQFCAIVVILCESFILVFYIFACIQTGQKGDCREMGWDWQIIIDLI